MAVKVYEIEELSVSNFHLYFGQTLDDIGWDKDFIAKGGLVQRMENFLLGLDSPIRDVKIPAINGLLV